MAVFGKPSLLSFRVGPPHHRENITRVLEWPFTEVLTPRDEQHSPRLGAVMTLQTKQCPPETVPLCRQSRSCLGSDHEGFTTRQPVWPSGKALGW